MAAVGRPILLGVEGESKDILIKYNAGLSFVPENKESFINQLLELKNNKDLYAAAEKGCRKLAEDFDSKRLANNMLTLINNTIISNR
jgi:hypothetical protein